MLGETCFLDGTNATLPASLSTVVGCHCVRLEAVGLLWLAACVFLQHQSLDGPPSASQGAGEDLGNGALLLQEALCGALQRHGVVQAERARLWRFKDRALHATVALVLQACAMLCEAPACGAASGRTSQLVASLDAVGAPSAAADWSRAARSLFQAHESDGARRAAMLSSASDENAEGVAPVSAGTAGAGAVALARYRGAELEALAAWKAWLADKFAVAPTAAEGGAGSGSRRPLEGGSAVDIDGASRLFVRAAATAGWYGDGGGARAHSSSRAMMTERLNASWRSTLSDFAAEASSAAAADADAAEDAATASVLGFSRRRASLDGRGPAPSAPPAAGTRRPRGVRPMPAAAAIAAAAGADPSPVLDAAFDFQASADAAAARSGAGPCDAPAPAVVLWAPPPTPASAVGATSAVLARLGDAVVDVKAAFDSACAASQAAAGITARTQVPGAVLLLLDEEDVLRALLETLGHAYPAGCHAAAQLQGMLPPEASGVGEGGGGRHEVHALSFSLFLRLLAFVMDVEDAAGAPVASL